MFQSISGMRYVLFLKYLHEHTLFDWYMEVGCRRGRTFAGVRGKTVAVDPMFRLHSDVMGTKPALHIFQQTSDDFFASGALKALKVKLSFSFLDGMHLFEFLLRDIINTEKNASPQGVIALHDCIPFSHEMTTRTVEDAPRDGWTGDVWKLIPILQEHRPDLTIDVLDCRPTGLVLLSGLNPKSQVLSRRYDKIVSEWAEVTLEDYGTNKFFDSFDIQSSREEHQQGFPRFKDVALDPDEALIPEFKSP